MKILRLCRTKQVRLVLCVIVSLAFLYLAARGMNLEDAVQQLKRSSPMPILGALFFLFVSFWIRAYRWSYLLLPVKKISTRPLFRATLIGFMGNYLFPFRAGEIMRAVSIGNTQRINKAAALGSILLERVFDGVVLSLTPFLFLAVLDLAPWVLWVNLALLTVYVAGLLVLLLALYVAGLLVLALAAQRGWTELWFDPITGTVARLIGKRLASIAADFLQGMKGVTHAGALVPVCFFSLLCWLVHGMYFFLLFKALNLNLTLWAALILQVVIGLGVILPAGPGYVGNFEYFTVVGLALFGITQEAAFAYALLAHIVEFIPVTAVGLFFAFKSGFQREAEVLTKAPAL
jgi:uncharacterized protein (TIRG00374 family)